MGAFERAGEGLGGEPCSGARKERRKRARKERGGGTMEVGEPAGEGASRESKAGGSRKDLGGRRGGERGGEGGLRAPVKLQGGSEQ